MTIACLKIRAARLDINGEKFYTGINLMKRGMELCKDNLLLKHENQ